MKISKATHDILQNFATINTGIVIKKGDRINTRSTNKSIYAEATVADAFDFDGAIYELPEFLKLSGVLGADADIVLNGDVLKITSGSSAAMIPLADESTVPHPKKFLTFPVADVVFDLSAERLTNLRKVSAVMGLNMLSFASVDGKIVARLSGKDAGEKGYTTEIADYDGTATFEYFVGIENLKIVDGAYKVLCSHLGAVKFEGEVVSYIISIDSQSTYTA